MYVIARCATVLALLSLLCAHDAAAAANGVTLSIFNNTALAGAPSTTKTLDTFSVTIPSSGAPFSAEAVAALSLPGEEGGLFTFSCEFTGVTTAFFWVDDHLVCQSGAYEWGKDGNDTDATLHGLSKRSGLVVRLRLMYNGSTPQPEALARATGAQRTAPRGSDGGAQGGGASVSAGVTWRVWPSAGYVPLPTTLLTTALPAVEVQRASLQDSLAQGWGTWMHNSVMDVVLLPEASRVTVALCQLSSGRCLSSAVFEDKDTIRAGPIAYDGSYAQYYVWFDSVNVSVSISADPTQRASGAPLNILVEPQSCNGNCSDYAVAFLGSFGWFRAGAVTASAELGQLVLDAYNLRTSSAFVATSAGGSSPPSAVSLPANATTLPYVAVALQETVSVSLNVGERRIPTASVAAAISTARAAETARYAKYGDLSSAKEAVQAGVMWNVVYTPAEVGGVLAPVARSWTFAPSPVNSDWTYVVFDWDNFFASLLLGLDARDLAYSNLIQVVRSKTTNGFIPNYAAGGRKSQDRTEPPVGSKVLLELYKAYGDAWLVELLFDDLLDWHRWTWAQRRLEPLGLVALGSGYVKDYPDTAANHMQGARYESGLDNSPMYDGDFFDNTTHLMQLYDVGMSSMSVADADALSRLAKAIGRPEAAQLQADADAMRSLIAGHLWDAQGGTFTNKFDNGTFYRRISPTTFYPLMASAASDSQATQMMSAWLLNATRFCINEEWPVGQKDWCYFGLPSISADDAAFPKLGYWRGYTWGPMAMLTYWSLEEYVHLPSVKAAKAALCKQMTAMMLNQWHMNRHICENFCPHRTLQCGSDCTGDHFYHWGALTGLISLMDAGHYPAAAQ